MSDRRIAMAQQKAQNDAGNLVLVSPDRKTRALNLAIGDPQASLSQFLRVLDHKGLLSDEGRIRSDVSLVTLGDHFDWGRPADRASAAEDGLRILAWLAAHPPDQVQILLGNHDLVRVAELSGFSNQQFAEAQSRADAALDEAKATAAFRSRYPSLASPSVIARDYACFDQRQRALMTRLLLHKRVRLAVAPSPDLLLIHAGVTVEDLNLLKPLPTGDAVAIAKSLNSFLEARVTKWKGAGQLNLTPLHLSGSAADGEASGLLLHRPTNPQVRKLEPNDRRRYDPRSLPQGIVQVIGHISDKKCRELLGHWVERKPPKPGAVRGLKISDQVSYHTGCTGEDRLVFLDGSMHQVPPSEYEIYDLDTRLPAVVTSSS